MTVMAAPDVQSGILQGSHLSQRLQTLQGAGHSNLDPQAQVALASQPTSDQQMSQQADVVQQAISGSQTFLGTVFDDPVLHKAPSLALTLHRYISGTMGWLPVAQEDLNHVQSQLQSAGYGKGLAANGVWDGGWGQAYSQYSQAFHQAQAGGKHGHGGGSWWDAITHFASSLLPSHAIPAIIGFVKSIPDDVRQVVADVGGAAAGVAHDISHLSLGHDAGVMARTSASIENFLGGSTTPQQVEHDQTRRIIGDFGNLLAVTPILKAGSAVADAAGEAISKGVFTDLGVQAAQRGPGTLAGLLYRSPRYWLDDTGTLRTLNPGGALSAKFLDNMPVVRRAMPAVRTAADKSQTFYYTARTTLAQPMRIAGVNAAANIAAHVELAGAQVRGVAGLETALGGRDNPLPKNVYNEHVMTGPLATALDWASVAFHGPLQAKPLDLARTPADAAARPALGGTAVIGITPSQSVGDLVRTAHAGYDASQGRLGLQAAFEQGTGLNYDELVKRVGESEAQDYLNVKLNEFAANVAAHDRVDGQNLVGQRFFDALRDEEHNVWSEAANGNPARLTDARNRLVTSFTDLQQAWKRDSNSIEGDPRSNYSKGIENYVAARKAAYRIVTEYADQLITPASIHAVSDARREFDFSSALGHPPASGPPDLTASYLTANPTTMPAGSLGLAVKDRVLKPQARAFAQSLHDRLTGAGLGEDGPLLNEHGAPLPVDRTVVERARRDAYRYLIQELGAHPQYLDGRSPHSLADEITARAESLATPVKPALGHDPQLGRLVDQLDKSGYQLVYGTDIGHAYAPPLIDPVVVDGEVKLRRKLASGLGLGSIPVSSEQAARQFRLEVTRTWQRAINDGTVKAPPGYNAARLLQHMDATAPSKLRLRFGEKAAMRIPGFSRALQRQAADAVRGDGFEPTADRVDEKLREIEKGLAAGTSLLDVSPKEFVAALTAPAPGIVNEMRGAADSFPLMSQRDAMILHRLYVGSLLKRPKWMMGGLIHSDGIRGGMAFLGAKAADVPVVGRAALKVSGIPQELVRFRNRYRFTLNPEFSARRVVKTALKNAVEGAPVTVTPYATMVKQGTLNDDLALVNRLFPEHRNLGEGFDDLDRTLWHADAFGIYNPRHYMALLAGTLKRAGFSDSDIIAKINRANTYGSRTALERTIGTLWYPFSFDKTLYRNLGGALLDNPGQRFLVYAASDAYHALDKHAHIGDWVQAHLPILNELEKLNAFSHGIGPGEFLGINAPYVKALWNAFGPQYNTNPHAAYDAVTAALPVLSELNSLLLGYNPTTHQNEGGELVQQGQISYWAARNTLDDVTRQIFHDPRSPWNPQHPAETTQAQVENGWQMRNQLITQLSKVIDYNYHHRNAEYTFPTSFGVSAVAGQPVTKTAVSLIVHEFYPSFNVAAAAKLAQEKKIASRTFVADLQHRDPTRAAAYSAFSRAADKAASYLSKDEYDTATAAKVTDQFRRYATTVSEQDPEFYRYYRSYYQSVFGPLENVTL